MAKKVQIIKEGGATIVQVYKDAAALEPTTTRVYNCGGSLQVTSPQVIEISSRDFDTIYVELSELDDDLGAVTAPAYLIAAAAAGLFAVATTATA